MLAAAAMPLSWRQRCTAAAAVAAIVGAWDLALFVFIGGAAPSRVALARAAFLDAALALPVALLALSLAQPLSHRRTGRPSPAMQYGLLARASLPALAFGILLVPAAALREAVVALTAGAAAGLAGAADALSSPLDAGRWLCTAAAGRATASSTAARDTLATSAVAALLLQVPALPAFLAALTRRWGVAAGHAVTVVAAVVASGVLVLSADARPERAAGLSLGPACQPGLDVRIYTLSAVEVNLPPSPDGGRPARARVFALDGDLAAIRAGRWPLAPDGASPGSGGDPLTIGPLVLRARLGECLHVVFTNRLRDSPAAFRVHGLPHLVTGSGGIGALPPDTSPRPGETLTYSFQIPTGSEWARRYLVQDGGGGTAGGPLAALVVEPLRDR